MTHIVQRKIAAVRRRAQRLWWLYALSGALLVTVSGLFLAGLADYAIRPRETGLRILLALGGWSVAVLAVYRFVIPLFRHNLSNLEVAQRIERKYPHLQGRLSSALAFLDQPADDSAAGSLALRRAVVAQATDDLEQLNLSGVVNPREAARLASLALAALFVVGVFAAMDLPAATLALSHLTAPWGNRTWPHWNRLEFTATPPRIAQGSNLELEVVDAGDRLPESVVLEYRWHNEEGQIQDFARGMTRMQDRMVFTLENVTRELEYRARGGDDETPWYTVEVATAAHVSGLQIRIHPPVYSGVPVAEAQGQIEAWEGSLVEVQGTVNRSIAQVQLKVESSNGIQTYPAEVTDEGTSFVLSSSSPRPWKIDAAGAYWIELIDHDRLQSSESRWEIAAHPDRPPTLTCDRPAVAAYYTAAAVVPLVFQAADDLAIERVELRYQRSDRTDLPEVARVLYQGSQSPPAQSETALPAAGQQRARRTVEAQWNLGELANLKPGVVLSLHGVAYDYKPQAGGSPVQRITIVSPEEMQERLAQRQASITALLAETLQQEIEARAGVRSLELLLARSGALADGDHKRLQSIEFAQRQVEGKLVGAGQGAAALASQLLQDAASNQLERSDVASRLNELLGELRKLGRGVLPQIGQQLLAAVRTWPERATGETELPRTALVAAGQQQDEVILVLQQQIDELSRLESYRRFGRELERIRTAEEDLSQRTIVLRTLAASSSEPSLPDLPRAADEQAELARAFHKVWQGLGELKAKLRSTDPAVAETLGDALAAADTAQIEAHLLDVQTLLKAQRFEDASQLQHQLLADLAELIAILDHRRDLDLDRTVKKLKEAEDELVAAQESRRQLHWQLSEATRLGDPSEQRAAALRSGPVARALAEKLQSLARKVERLGAMKASQFVGQAASRIGQAQDKTAQGDASAAARPAQAAQLDLEQAQRDLAQAVQQAEEELQREQMAQLEQQVLGLVGRQKSVVEEVQRLDTLRLQQPGKQLAAEQLATVLGIARNQRSIASETRGLSDRLSTAQAVQFALQAAGRPMLRAAGRLERREVDRLVQESARDALERLQLIADSLKPVPPPAESSNPPQKPANPPPPAPAGPPGLGMQALAELRLLKGMQEQLNVQTARIQQRRGENVALAPADAQELTELAAQQNQLAEMVLRYAQGSPPPTDSPAPSIEPPKEQP